MAIGCCLLGTAHASRAAAERSLRRGRPVRRGRRGLDHGTRWPARARVRIRSRPDIVRGTPTHQSTVITTFRRPIRPGSVLYEPIGSRYYILLNLASDALARSHCGAVDIKSNRDGVTPLPPRAARRPRGARSCVERPAGASGPHTTSQETEFRSDSQRASRDSGAHARYQCQAPGNRKLSRSRSRSHLPW